MTDVSESPTRMTTRGQRINYAELNSSSSANQYMCVPSSNIFEEFSSYFIAILTLSSLTNHHERFSESSETSASDSVFRSPTASTRGRKRRTTHDDAASLSSWSVVGFVAPVLAEDPKRGRPRGAGVTRGARGGGVRRSIFGEQQVAGAAGEIEETGLFGAVKTGRNLEVFNVFILLIYAQTPPQSINFFF
ncbi:unnamed protein product [Strongylus vulgaris]|uniref:Uncharacterized protein n=1 Tax=Strongylus vulgaris TaxID=40348 RepID=A0A3P7KZP2_STRVU|nr:unnamed protein product [Strongylus vulgaris]